MDKQYQDIHYEDTITNKKFVLRCIHITQIDMRGDFIEIHFEFPNESAMAKLSGGNTARAIFLPKIRGTKLIID